MVMTDIVSSLLHKKPSGLKASFVIASYKHTDLLQTCIKSILKNETKRDEYEIIVVDDASPEADQLEARKFCEDNGVRFIVKEQNGGYVATANTGILAATGGLVIMVNNDVEFLTPCMDSFRDSINTDPKIAIVGCKLVYPDNKIQHGGVEWARGTDGEFYHAYHKSDRRDPRVCTSRYCISVTGAVYAIDAAKLRRLGLLNDDYFISYDDSEYSVNCWSRGLRVFYNGSVEAIHLEGFTRGNTPATKAQKGTWQKELQTREHYLKNIRAYNLSFVQHLVHEANIERQRANKTATNATSVVTSGRKRLVVKRRGALGDVVLTVPVVRHIKSLNPDADVIVATDCGVVYQNNPYVAGVIRTDDIPSNVDAIYDLDMAYEHKPKMHIIDAYSQKVFNHCKIDKKLELFPSDNDHAVVQNLIRDKKINPNDMVLIHMAVTWKNRTWPISKWMEVVEQLSQSGYSVVTVGSERDFRIGKPMHNVTEMQGQLSIQQIYALSSMARCFVASDSGLMHVAGCTDVPIVGIFTSANPEYRMPFRGGILGNRFNPVTPSINCRFCLHDEPPPVTYCGCKRSDFACLTQITPSAVVKAVHDSAGTVVAR